MARWHDGWKVLLSRDRRSCWITGKAGVTYPVNKVAEPHPKCGPLAVFETEETARRFQNMIDATTPAIIVRCEYQKARARTVFSPYSYSIIGASGIMRRKSGFPEGTVLASRVRCLE